MCHFPKYIPFLLIVFYLHPEALNTPGAKEGRKEGRKKREGRGCCC
jgi:hypothetical protein